MEALAKNYVKNVLQNLQKIVWPVLKIHVLNVITPSYRIIHVWKNVMNNIMLI